MNKELKEDSIQKRYGVKLITAIFGIPLSMIIQLILPRAFSIIEYAKYSYNMNFFNSIISLFDSSTSSAFYSKLSKRPKENALVKFFILFLILIFFVLNIFILGAFFINANNVIWEEQSFKYVYLGMFTLFLTYLVQIITSMSDAYTLTMVTEKFKLIQKIILACGITLIFVLNKLSLELFYIISSVTLIIFIFATVYTFIKRNKLELDKTYMNRETFSSYTSEFIVYCKPIFLLTLLNSLVNIIERWCLQRFSGDSEQAYFGFANQISSVLALIVAPIMSLLIREFSILIKDKAALGVFYEKVMKSIYSMIAYFACFILVNADYIIVLIGGDEYTPALSVLRIMMIYSISQTWGQINGSLFFASERTKLYSKMGAVGLVLTMFFGYFFIAPNAYGGLGLGAEGLGLKLVIVQLITVHISNFLNTKYLGILGKKLVFYQFVPVTIFIILSYGCRIIYDYFNFNNEIIIAVIIQGIIYTFLSVLFIYIRPEIIGLDRKYISNIKNKIYLVLKRKK